jgi:DNA-directed RNA polymerase subunit RPC12/RpoP
VVLVALVALLFVGCHKNEVDQALDSDANGYVCLGCKAKFYTARKVFPTRCPDCKKNNFEQVVGFVCSADKQMTLEGRSRSSAKCKRCGVTVTGLGMPQTVDLKAWGATLKTETEVTGQ